MSAQTVWIGEASLKAGSGTRHVIILAYATDREDFIRQVEAYFQETGDQGQFLLAPLDANTYFTRHGKVWLLSPIRTLGGTVKIIPLDDADEHRTERKDYLLRHEIPGLTPLDDQAGRYPPRFAPDELFTLLWPHGEIPANRFDPDWRSWQPPTFPLPETDPKTDARDREIFGENPPPLNVYFLADGARVWNFPDLYADYRCESLFQGKLAETYDEDAPFLLEIVPMLESPLRALFSSPQAAANHACWADEAGIFIHSRHDFASLRTHLRKLVYIPVENQRRRSFLRFYNPRTLRRYLETIASHPDKLARFFGADERIIHGLGAGMDNRFTYYQLRDLENARPAEIMLTQWERDGMREVRWQEIRDELSARIYQQMADPPAQERIAHALDQARGKGYRTKLNTYRYAVCALKASAQGKDIRALEAKLDQAKITDPKHRLIHLWHNLSGEAHG